MNNTRMISMGGAILWLLLMSGSAVLLRGEKLVQNDLWSKVEEAMAKGLPKTAVDSLRQIIPAAIREKKFGEAAKAITRKIALEGSIQGNRPEEKIVRLESEIKTVPGDLKPILEAVLAHWYWQYFQQNRWRFMGRTATAASPGSDFTTWDLPRLFQEIGRHFDAALASPGVLEAIPIADYDMFLPKGDLPDNYRPTLYDFLAHQALEFYTSGEQAAAQPEDQFTISADSAIFAPMEKFLGWKPESGDSQSGVLKALRLYQDLLRFHQTDTDPAARLDLDLERLEYGVSTAFGEEKNSRYRQAMQAFQARWADHPLSALAGFRLAQSLASEGKQSEAHRVASAAVKRHPKSDGAKMCLGLIAQIEAKESSIQAERVWNAPWPKIQVAYRNVTHVYFRLVAKDWFQFLENGSRRGGEMNDEEKRRILRLPAAKEWDASLSGTTDFLKRTESVPVPEGLRPGCYYLVAGHQPGFVEKDNQISFTEIWVSRLALVVRTRDTSMDGFVMDAESGEPLGGARILRWSCSFDGNCAPGTETVSDDQGYFLLPGARPGTILMAQHKGHEIASEQPGYPSEPPAGSEDRRTIFFTDRAIYRPGQTIFYKGICLVVDPAKDSYQVLGREKVTVVFSDVNGKEIGRQTLQSNIMGSFAGSFTAPGGTLTGSMTLRVMGGPEGSASIRVEEYKRPRFFVRLDKPKAQARLNDKVDIQGKAENYTGAAVDNALVRYRVVRKVRFPDWWGGCFWWRPRPAGIDQEILHGTTRTARDGTFHVEFQAKPDPAVSAADEPVFTYSVFADATDSSGETRSAQKDVRVSYASLQMDLQAGSWLPEDRDIQFRIRTSTLDSEALSAEGSLKVFELQSPARILRANLSSGHIEFPGLSGPPAEATADVNSWPLGKVVFEKGFATDVQGKGSLSVRLPTGAYRVLAECTDRYGKKVTAQLPLEVIQPAARQLKIKKPFLLESPSWSVNPGQEFLALWGTGYPSGRAIVEIEHRRKIIKRYWTGREATQETIRMPVGEELRGGFYLHVTQIRENRAYLESRYVEVPWTNKELSLRWEHFTSKLLPGQKETWTAVVRGADAERQAAEVAAVLYDRSLDAFMSHQWLNRFSFFRLDQSAMQVQFENRNRPLLYLTGRWNERFALLPTVSRTYRSFPPEIVQFFWGLGLSGAGGPRMRMAEGMAPPPLPAPMAAPMAATMKDAAVSAPAEKESARPGPGIPGGGGAGSPKADLDAVSARRNLQETAFFLPQLLTDSKGQVRMEFTMPEALTSWKFMAFAHDRQLRSGSIEDTAVTAKDLMVQPNAPRFLREGDIVEFAVKVSNQSERAMQGTAALTFLDGFSERGVDGLLANSPVEKSFEIASRESRSLFWRLKVPEGIRLLRYKAVAAAGRLSDGEEGWLPVLSRKVLVTESLSFSIRGPATRTFELPGLLQSASSPTLSHKALSLQVVSQPAWYAVLALPYLMEYPFECSEQIFNRLFANSLAEHIVRQNPKIAPVFERWRGTPALSSPLEKNQELKSVLLEETPWVRQAQQESQARRNVAILFESSRLKQEQGKALERLRQMQLADGSWPWFPGGRSNPFITLYIAAGTGRLRHLGVELDTQHAVPAFAFLDRWMLDQYQRIRKTERPEEYVPSSLDALYLYGRSFFLKEMPVPRNCQEMAAFYIRQSKLHWLKNSCRQSQAQIALALKRWGGADHLAVAASIMKSILERSVVSEELGRFWRDTERSWWWYQAPVETQALMIEALDEVSGDRAAVEECRVWLLKQKQTQEWKTTKATADAVYALLMRGSELLSSDSLLEVSLAGQPMAAEQAEAGTGFYEKRFADRAITPSMGAVAVARKDSGVSWGSLNWQYLEDIARVKPYTGTPLTVKKSLFVKRSSGKGPVLEAVRGPLAVGDELVVRIELRVDRDMEFVHMKDHRGSGLEPVQVLSGYRYQDGLAYYQSTRDTASHFFLDYLPKGSYLFEYPVRVQLRGEYQTGITSIQCMYAPEFNSHSESTGLMVP